MPLPMAALRALAYFFEEALISLWRSRLVNALSVGTIAVSLFVLGAFLTVAANLNVFGSYIYMNRASNTGTPIGSFRGGIAATGATAYRVNPGFALNSAGTTQGAAVPNVPDDYLGWEANVGVDWKLLEGFTASLLVAYWKPGKWFNYACIDRSVPGWNVPAAGNFWGTRPDKSIDAIFGSQFSLVLAF